MEIPEEYLAEEDEEQTYSHYVNNHTRSSSNKYNNDLYPSNDVEGTIYYKMKDEDVKLERTDRKYPVKSNLTRRSYKDYICEVPTL